LDDQGQAFLYYGSATGLGQAAHPIGKGARTSSYGYAVGTAGDVNGDGYDDVIVGTHYFDSRTLKRAYLYLGSATGLGRPVAWSFEPDEGYAGSAVGTAGDVNGDGFADVIVGDDSFWDPGEVHGFFGSQDGPSLTPDWSLEGNTDQAELGESVGTAGDVNGDGYDDVITGARSYGRVYYHLGPGARSAPLPGRAIAGRVSFP